MMSKKGSKHESQYSKQALMELMREVSRHIETGAFKPPMLPEVALNLGKMASRDDVRLNDIETTVAQDPAVAARILSVARSALYSRGAPVESLRVAIMRIGLREVRDISYQFVAQTQIFNVPLYSERIRDLFEAAQASGLIARELCRILMLESDLAYLCGLLHDVGEAIVLGIIADLAKGRSDPLPPLNLLSPVVDRYSAPVGARVCQSWNLPEPIIDAILFHHTPGQSTEPQKMAAITAATDIAMERAGMSCQPEDLMLERQIVFDMLGMTNQQVDALFTYAEMLAETPEQWMISETEGADGGAAEG